MSILVRRLALFRSLTLSTCLIGCLPQEGGTGGTSSSSGGSGSKSDGGRVTAAAQACLDTAHVFATAAKRCGGDYDAERTALIRELANGDCNTVSIRNETELRTMCFPSLTRIACNDLKENRFAPSCAEQLIP